MGNIDHIIHTLKTAMPRLAARYHIDQLAVFGSHSRGDERPDSDVDVLVSFSLPIGIRFIDLADELEEILDKKVDLVSRNAIKKRYFDAIKDQLIYV